LQDLFIFVCILDPRQRAVMSKTLADFQSIPNILSAASERSVLTWLQKRAIWWHGHPFWRAG